MNKLQALTGHQTNGSGQLYDISSHGFINTGDGDDIITGTGAIMNVDIIYTGNGKDSISQRVLINYGGVFLGDGDDSIVLNPNPFNLALDNFSFFETGEGDDIISSTGVIDNKGIINTGNGEDFIISQGKLTNTGHVFLEDGGCISLLQIHQVES